ncbi:MAG TPA: M1 family peptidase [Pricia antarctica]|uniref:Aminopeptidase N n=3 Tax=root TaxID=1 RepID=A0A831QPP8_9FLAO|nr:M1 family peptidase [Pricia antarctica]
MIERKFLILALLVALLSAVNAQDTYERNASADVQNYIFNLGLNDSTDQIQGEAEITVGFNTKPEAFALDLIGGSETYGMTIADIFEGDEKANYTFQNNKIKIVPSSDSTRTRIYRIQYQGTPERGLVIDTTKFGKRSFFGDNWPNLARHWLPAVDHPYDKASIEFRITAPEHYDVVATGEKIEESSLNNGYKLTVYKEPAPVAMKVVTIGVTQFASRLVDEVYDIPVTAWVYPENRLEGFSDYSVASEVLKYFIDNIGPYSYAKLANMQAKTQWGGLENAGTIAYFENSVTGKNEVEGLIAHEIAHQWFGNSATENDWNHVWLSEGFATYFAILYQENVYGDEKRKEELAIDRKEVFEYYLKNPSPIIDQSITDPLKVLSVNTYQKAGWVLNMLRHKLGEGVFWEGIRTYYSKFQNANAMTDDFRKVMEEVSGTNLKAFFDQWLLIKGQPEIKWDWTYRNGKIDIAIDQIQDHYTFQFPLEIGIVCNGQLKINTLQIDKKSTSFTIPAASSPDALVLDPESWLLFEEKK